MRTKRIILISILAYISIFVFTSVTLAGPVENYERTTQEPEAKTYIQKEMSKEIRNFDEGSYFGSVTELFISQEIPGITASSEMTEGSEENSSGEDDGITMPAWGLPGRQDSPDEPVGLSEQETIGLQPAQSGIDISNAKK